MNQIIDIMRKLNTQTITVDANTVKGIFKNRHVQVTYNRASDSFDIYAFTLKGTKFSNEKHIKDVLIENIGIAILDAL